MEESIARQLMTPSAFPHETYDFKIMETHISWVILTGLYAYKIKKPVNLGFVDYSTLEKRHEFCKLELALNRSLAPQLYLGVVAITQGNSHPEIEGQGPILDYAIKMHQFEQNRLLSNVHRKEGLSKAIVQSLADQIAVFHQSASKVSEGLPFGTPDNIMRHVRDNFKTLMELEPSKVYEDEIAQAEIWAEQQFNNLMVIFKRRKEQHHIKVCHGDLHLGNIVLIEGVPRVFDAIEFNDDFRFLDPINDMAFLCMDLEHKGYQALSNYFTNIYFEKSGDYEGALLLDFYKAYRAMVRAKISAFQFLALPADQAEQRQSLKKDIKTFLDLALSYQTKASPQLTITFGASGSGKSVYTEKLMTEGGAIRLRSDVIRKQLFDLDPYEPCPEQLTAQIYSKETTEIVYKKLSDWAQLLLSHQIPVIADATFLKAWQRRMFMDLSQALQVKFEILVFDNDRNLLEARLKERKTQRESSDADASVLDLQLASLEPLTGDELAFARGMKP